MDRHTMINLLREKGFSVNVGKDTQAFKVSNKINVFIAMYVDYCSVHKQNGWQEFTYDNAEQAIDYALDFPGN